MNFTSWTREPLVHFVAVGAILYIALTWGGAPPDPASRLIRVGPSERERIAESWTMTMGRSPTDAELDNAIDAHVREEVLYREALRLGLDEGDAIVRRRLVSKMDFMASLAAETADPSDDVLRAFLEANIERYEELEAMNATLSFEQAYFAEETNARASQDRGAVKGEPTSLPAAIRATPMRDITSRFGRQFAEGLSELEPGEAWQGPIASSFGWHLVRLTERKVEPPDFESLRPTLATDWRNEQINLRKRRAYDVLASAYRIDIEW